MFIYTEPSSYLHSCMKNLVAFCPTRYENSAWRRLNLFWVSAFRAAALERSFHSFPTAFKSHRNHLVQLSFVTGRARIYPTSTSSCKSCTFSATILMPLSSCYSLRRNESCKGSTNVHIIHGQVAFFIVAVFNSSLSTVFWEHLT